MSQVSGISFQLSRAGNWLVLCLLLVLAAPLCADSKDTNLKPLDNSAGVAAPVNTGPEVKETTDPALEKKYRDALEQRLADERKSYEGSLRSLWLANSAVWACLLGFIIFQALAARKRSAELERLKAEREGK
jgi:hypothetical protein